ATTSGLILSSAGTLQPVGPRLEKLAIGYGKLAFVASTAPTANALCAVVARSAGDRWLCALGPSFPAEKITTTPAASQLSIAFHQRVSQSVYPPGKLSLIPQEFCTTSGTSLTVPRLPSGFMNHWKALRTSLSNSPPTP